MGSFRNFVRSALVILIAVSIQAASVTLDKSKDHIDVEINEMLNSQGAKGEHAIWGKVANWIDYSGTISGRPDNQ